jgi:hypothetical protein
MSCYEAENQKIARRYLDREHLFLQPFKADPKTHFNTDHLDNDVLYRLLHTYPFRLYSRRSRIIHAGQTNDTNSVNVLLEKVFIRVCSMRFWRIMHLITEMRIRAGKFWGVDHGGRIGQ